MIDDKIYLVAARGLSNSEMRFIKIMLALTSHRSTIRAQGRYELTDDLKVAEMVILNAEDEVALNDWHKISGNNQSATVVLISAANQHGHTKYNVSRPLAPAKILMMLDLIVEEKKNKFADPGRLTENTQLSQPDNILAGKLMAGARQRALVVDDSPAVRKQILLELASFNIEVDTAENGEQCLLMLKDNRYDIIFLDVVMPGADGYQVCRAIRRKQDGQHTPIVMLTSKSSPFDRIRGTFSGCSGSLTKPVDYDNFYRVLEDCLAIAQGDEEDDTKYA